MDPRPVLNVHRFVFCAFLSAAAVVVTPSRAELVLASTVLPYPLNAQPYYIASGDFDGDEIPDLATGDLGDEEGYLPFPDVVIYLGSGGGEFAAAIHLSRP